ncbi:MAG: GH3 auxin-responsive promoter family protein, partial [Bacteroidales bacterium]|nr:GH3 auxin-responsive promoter family protein [Bacteroidales bacterium]
MSFIDSIYLKLMRKRLREIDGFSVHAGQIQQKQLNCLLQKAADTEYGKKYGFSEIRSAKDFSRKVPLITYPDLQTYVERLMRGENGLLWPESIKWFSKSSGTTHSQSKYIPVSREALYRCHYKGGKDLFALYLQSHPESGVFSGKNISMGGSLHAWPDNPHIRCGDVSAIITQNLPFWAEHQRAPRKHIALMDEWEAKLQKMAETTIRQDVRSFLGVPSWTLLFLQKALALSGKQNLSEVWPNMELFVHGGVSFTPYAEQFKKLI